MNRSLLALGLGLTAAGIACSFERDAKACGGCFHPPSQVASDITDERMLLSVSPTQTTLYDQISYSGSPTSFAWVLPIHGTVQVGLSADVLFDSVDVLTQTTIQAPAPQCPAPPADCASLANGGTAGFGGGSGSSGGGLASPPTVTVTKQENVGPYETVQLHATDSSALNNWLTQNGFSIPADVTPVVDEYVTEGFDFLAMKLLPGAGVQSTDALHGVRVKRVESCGAETAGATAVKGAVVARVAGGGAVADVAANRIGGQRILRRRHPEGANDG